MNTIEIKNKFDVLLKQLSDERSFDVAEKVTAELVGLLNIKIADRFLVNIPRVDAEVTRFQLAPGFARQAAAYELPHEDGKPIDLKLFWAKKTSKTNLSWLIGLTPNFEDALSNDYKNIGIDFVVPETCDSVIVLLSNRFKIRALELKDHITPTQLEIFAQWAKLSEIEIADQNELKNTLHSKLWESFNFEPINRKFYLELVEYFSILVHHLEKDFGRKQSVMFTTRLIGRLLFIWFLKKKNLVNTNVNYFSVPDPEKQSEYYKNQLEKLFFEVLNRDELERNNGDKLTPYLNGGLFDKSTTDFCDDPKLTFPNGYFNQLFDTLNKYNFTVDESSPEFQHVAIDPEMLGRIFESLLAEQIDENTGNSKKKATGAFYTPREIVSYMCEQSLIEYLKTKLPDSSDRDHRLDELIRLPETIFRDQDQNKRDKWRKNLGKDSVIRVLNEILILDPAVGSGAFPMGMLHLLVKVYSRLEPKFEKDVSGLKRDILSRSLYGVDIEQTAIEITRLRAWLSIIVDIPEGEKVEPLPNLEFKFVCANTLIPLDKNNQGTLVTNYDLKKELINIRDEYFKTSSKKIKEKLQKKYNELTQASLFGETKGDRQLKSYKPFDVSSSSEFYDPELMHGVQSFDIVIGNPPYVSYGLRGGQKISSEDKNLIRKLYPNSAEYKISLYALFMDKAMQLSREEGGVQALIVPDSFLLGRYFSKIRATIIKNNYIREFILFYYGIFAATVGFSVVYVFQRTKNIDKDYNLSVLFPKSTDDLLARDVRSFSYPQIYFSKTKYNRFRLFFDAETKSLISKIDEHSIELGSIYTGRTGVRSKIGQKNIISKNKDNEFFQKGIISGGQITRYGIKYDGDYININPKLLNGGGWDYEVIHHPKILLRQTADNLIGTIDVDNFYHLNNVHSFAPKQKDGVELEYILAILNSKLMNYFYQKTTLEEGRAMAQTDIETIESLPIRLYDINQKKIIVNLVNQILTLKKQNKDADTKNLESQIDQLVYKLYDLTEEEIGIIEDSSKK